MLKNYSADNIAPIVPVRKESCRHPCREKACLFLNTLPTNPVGKRPAFSLSICPHDNPIRGRPLTLLDPHPISNHPCREKARLFFNRFPHSNFGRGRPSTLQDPHPISNHPCREKARLFLNRLPTLQLRSRLAIDPTRSSSNFQSPL